MEEPTSAPKSYDDIEALQKCRAVIERVLPPEDRQRVVQYLKDKYLTTYPVVTPPGAAF